MSAPPYFLVLPSFKLTETILLDIDQSILISILRNLEEEPFSEQGGISSGVRHDTQTIQRYKNYATLVYTRCKQSNSNS